MDMVLAKSDIAIASRYAELVADAELRDAIFPRIRTEWQASIDDAAGRSPARRALLEGNPLLARSIRNRFPYLDPLNHLQVELLKRHRAPASGRAGAARHPPDHQRHRRGPAQQRVSGKGCCREDCSISATARRPLGRNTTQVRRSTE